MGNNQTVIQHMKDHITKKRHSVDISQAHVEAMQRMAQMQIVHGEEVFKRQLPAAEESVKCLLECKLCMFTSDETILLRCVFRTFTKLREYYVNHLHNPRFLSSTVWDEEKAIITRALLIFNKYETMGASAYEPALDYRDRGEDPQDPSNLAITWRR